jgi:ABC-type branched-subunit amino acid transport system permease subunit
VALHSIALDSLLALSVWVTLGSGRLSLAGPGFMACGAYVAAAASPLVHGSFLVCALAGAAASFAFGVIVERCTRRLLAAAYAIATLSIALAAPVIAQAVRGAHGSAHPAVNSVAAVACLAVGVAAVAFTRDRQRFAVGAAAAGLAGALVWATGVSLAQSGEFGLDRLGVMVVVALLGGPASPASPVLAAALLALLARLAAPLTGQPLIVDGCALAIALVYLPAGVWAPLAHALRAMVPAPKRSPDGTA